LTERLNNLIIEAYVVKDVTKRKLETKMKSVNFNRQHSIAQQGGCMPSYWTANNSLSLDRTPEIKIGVRSTVV